MLSVLHAMKPNPYLVLSSISFVIPTTVAANYRIWNLYAIFLYMTVVSSIYHATKYPPLLYLDYPGCYTLVFVVGYETYKIQKFREFIFSCSVCAILFWGGYFTKRFVFSENYMEKTITHCMLHIIVMLSGVRTNYLIHIARGNLLT